MELNEKKYLTLSEAAKYLGISRQTLQKWIERDKQNKKFNSPIMGKQKCPKYGQVGVRYRFWKEDVEKFLKESMGE